MKTKTLTTTLIATLCAIGLATAEDQSAVTGVNALIANPAEHSGKTVTITGIVNLVSQERKMFTLIDTSEADCTDACQQPTIIAELGPDLTTLPKPTETVVATGKMDASNSQVRVAVTELIFGKEAVEASSKR